MVNILDILQLFDTGYSVPASQEVYFFVFVNTVIGPWLFQAQYSYIYVYVPISCDSFRRLLNSIV